MTSLHPGHSSSSTYINRLPPSALAADSSQVDHGPSVIRLVENHPCGLVCTAHGGSPPPKIELSIERGRDLTALTTLLQTVSPAPNDNRTTIKTRTNRSSAVHVDGIWTTGSRRGFRLLTVMTVRSTRNYLPTADDDGRRLLCIVTVPGIASRVDAVVLDVDCEFIYLNDSPSLWYAIYIVIYGRDVIHLAPCRPPPSAQIQWAHMSDPLIKRKYNVDGENLDIYHHMVENERRLKCQRCRGITRHGVARRWCSNHNKFIIGETLLVELSTLILQLLFNVVFEPRTILQVSTPYPTSGFNPEPLRRHFLCNNVIVSTVTVWITWKLLTDEMNMSLSNKKSK